MERVEIRREGNGESPSVLLAMSGGVDSSVSAALLRDQGYRVTGATMKIWDEAREGALASPRVCCSLSAVEDAAAVCELLSLPFLLLEYQNHFRSEIVEDFCREYLRGRTPNPCVRCNTRIKFHHFLREADRMGCEYMATGHYARIARDPVSGRFLLRRGRDPDKDQSYFLYGVTQEVLGRLLFPVGDRTKEEVRELARRFGLPVARKEESQEICFLPDNDYAAFLRRRFPGSGREGPIVDGRGNVLGTHPGHIHFTIGQRRGLGVAHREPLYVVGIRSQENVVVVGPRRDLLRREVLVRGVHWIAGEPPATEARVTAKIRYRHRDAECRLIPAGPAGEGCRVRFTQPQEAVTPGQSIVFYEGDTVLGGGLIHEAV